MSIQVRSPRRQKRATQVSLGSLFPLLLIAGVALIASAAADRAFGTEPPKLTMAEKKFVRKCEQKLQTPYNSKDKNPGDRDTWYVIVFTDTALGRRQSHSVSGDILTITREMQAARMRAAKMAHGRTDAALLLLQYFYAGNEAAARLRPTARGTTDRARADASKYWEYKAFATEQEAQALLDFLAPKKE